MTRVVSQGDYDIGSIEIGTIEHSSVLMHVVKQVAVVDAMGEYILWRIGLLSKKQQTLCLVTSLVEAMGFPEGGEQAKIYEKGFSLGWVLCPPEAAPQYLLQHGKDMKEGDSLVFAIEPIRDVMHDGWLFGVHKWNGTLFLDTLPADRRKLWPSKCRMVFACSD